jgi:phosphosulfolactate synthase (CoM biosynthesis protein A)
MSQDDFKPWSTEKAKELFAISHKLMEAAKQLSEHHAQELKANMDHAMDLAKLTAKSDFAALKEIQTKATHDAVNRMTAYQNKVKGIIKQVSKEASEDVNKHLEKAREALNEYVDQAAKKMPMGGAELSKLVKDVTDAGAKVYKEGRKMVDHALENAEHQVDQVAKKATEMAKKSPAVKKSTRPTAKKTVRPAAKKAKR